MSDFDGDGVQDAAVLYTAADVPNICLAVLQKDADGLWQVQDAVEGLTDTVDTVRFARLQEGGANQILVGYTAQQADSYLAVYAYQEGKIEAILAEPYDQYLIENITGTGYEDLVVMDTDAEGASRIKLLTSDREGSFRQAAVMGLSADRFTGCASLAAGMGAYGGQYLVLDGWTGVTGSNLASVLLRYNEKTQKMEPARQIGADALYEASLRNVPDLTSRDLDRDGVVEIPTQPEGAGLINMDQGRRMDFILWMDYTSAQPRKSFGLLDEELGFYLELPMEWYGNPDADRRPGGGHGGTAQPGRVPAVSDGAGDQHRGPDPRLDPPGGGVQPPGAGPVRAGRPADGPAVPAVPLVLYLVRRETDGKSMVVEDEASIREVIALNLRRSGMEVLEAGSAEVALALLEQAQDCSAASWM